MHTSTTPTDEDGFPVGANISGPARALARRVTGYLPFMPALAVEDVTTVAGLLQLAELVDDQADTREGAERDRGRDLAQALSTEAFEISAAAHQDARIRDRFRHERRAA
jgi:hypothetical protein